MMKKEPENGRYTEDERARILNSFCRKPEVDPNVLLERIERAATFYQEWTAAKPYHSTKQSEIKRHFGRLQNAIRKLANEEQAAIRSPKDRDLSRRVDRRRAKIYASLRSMKESPDLYACVLSAAESLADREGSLPDFEATWYEIECFSQAVSVWPIEEQITKALESPAGLAWLERATAKASATAQLEIDLAGDKADSRARPRAGQEAWAKRPPRHQIRLSGNRPNEPLHWLMHMLVQIYRESATNPSGLTGDDISEQWAEIFYFLHECLAPLEHSLSFEGLRKLCQRAQIDLRPR